MCMSTKCKWMNSSWVFNFARCFKICCGVWRSTSSGTHQEDSGSLWLFMLGVLQDDPRVVPVLVDVVDTGVVDLEDKVPDVRTRSHTEANSVRKLQSRGVHGPGVDDLRRSRSTNWPRLQSRFWGGHLSTVPCWNIRSCNKSTFIIASWIN